MCTAKLQDMKSFYYRVHSVETGGYPEGWIERNVFYVGSAEPEAPWHSAYRVTEDTVEIDDATYHVHPFIYPGPKVKADLETESDYTGGQVAGIRWITKLS